MVFPLHWRTYLASMARMSTFQQFLRNVAWSLFALSLMPALGQSASPAKDPTPNNTPQVALVVLFGNVIDRLSLTYDHKVSEANVQTDLKSLAQRAGWSPSNVHITNERAMSGGGKGGNSPVMTSVEFTARALDPRTHSFPIEPLVLALRQYKRMMAVFMVPNGYPYWGPVSYQTPQVTLSGQANPGAYTFYIDVKDSSVNQFRLPLKDPKAPKRVEPVPKPHRSNLPMRLALVVVMTLGIAGIVYAIASLAQRKH